MANPQRGELDIDVNGKTYTLAIDINALCAMEEKLSTKDRQWAYPEIVQELMRSNIRVIRVFFWACLQKHHPEISLMDLAGLIMEAGGLQKFTDNITRLLDFTRPDAGDDAELKDDTGGRPIVAQAASGSRGTGNASTSRRDKSA